MVMLKLLLLLLAVSSSDILDAGARVGTSSNQVILGFLVVALIIIVIYRERQQVSANKAAADRHEEVMEKSDKQFHALCDQQDKDRSSWDEERKARIAMLMTLVGDNTRAMDKAANAVIQNSSVIVELKDVVNGFKELLYKLEHVLTQQPKRER